MSNCGHMEEYVDEMIAAVGAALPQGADAVRREWELAAGMKNKVATVLRMETGAMTLETLGIVSSSVRRMVRRIESGLRTINQLGVTWPVDGLDTWSPDVGGGEPLGQVYDSEGVGVGSILPVETG